MQIIKRSLEFEWDEGNRGKNFQKHKVSDGEREEVFFDQDKKIYRDVIHSGKEKRYILLGATNVHRILFVVFTIRKGRIRVISARDLNKTESQLYENKKTV